MRTRLQGRRAADARSRRAATTGAHRQAPRRGCDRAAQDFDPEFAPSPTAVKPLTSRPTNRRNARGLSMHRDRANWALAIMWSFVCLITPAIWNRFPLLQNDTGGYLARWYEGTLVPSRAVVYGLFLNAGSLLNFWPVIAVQAALTIWVIALMLRVHGLGKRPGLLLGVIVVLSVITTLPWLTAVLLTDIFCGLGVLALYLIVMRSGELKRWERIALFVLAAVSASTHSATLAVQLGLL